MSHDIVKKAAIRKTHVPSRYPVSPKSPDSKRIDIKSTADSKISINDARVLRSQNTRLITKEAKDTNKPNDIVTTRLQLLKNKSLKPQLPHQSLKSLNTIGYIVLKQKLKLTPKEIIEYKNLIDLNRDTRPIFNNNIGNNDNSRLMCPCLPPKQLEQLLLKWFPNKIHRDWHILKCKSGCKQQQFHCDYKPTVEILGLSDMEFPLIMLTSLSDNCELIIKENSCRYVDSQKLVQKTIGLQRGDVLVFRGDLVHCGASYEEDNYRLHCYLDSPGLYREAGKTFKV